MSSGHIDKISYKLSCICFVEPAARVGCGGMHRAVLLMAVLTTTIAPQSNITGKLNTSVKYLGET